MNYLVKHIRRAVQLILLVLFIYLIIETAYPLDKKANFFLNLSPLGILTMIATRTWIKHFLGGVIIFILTIFFGRFFCGWICPLGTTIDIFERIFSVKKRGKSGDYRWKYIIFTALLVLSILGFSIAGLFDPLCIAERTYGLVLYPYTNLLVNQGLEGAYRVPALTGTADNISDFLINKKIISLKQSLYSTHIFILSIFLLILLLSLKAKRYWCRNLCPLGAMLGLTSILSPYRRTVSDKCTLCTKCQFNCKMNAITESGKNTLNQECIYCFNCNYLCNEKAIKFNLINTVKGILKKNPEEEKKKSSKSEVFLTRRQLIAGGAAGVLTLPAVKLNYPEKTEKPFILRPPGAGEEENFLNLCINCGACMKICPTNALQPLGFEGGLSKIWTPRLVPRVGYCEYNCKLCSDICPTGAIKKMTLKEKQSTQIGMAYINTSRCIPYLRRESCMVCEEMCPIPEKAIKYRERTIKTDYGEEILKMPYIDENLCIGCGICENKCPVKGGTAIYVTTYKKKEDSYY